MTTPSLGGVCSCAAPRHSGKMKTFPCFGATGHLGRREPEPARTHHPQFHHRPSTPGGLSKGRRQCRGLRYRAGRERLRDRGVRAFDQQTRWPVQHRHDATLAAFDDLEIFNNPAGGTRPPAGSQRPRSRHGTKRALRPDDVRSNQVSTKAGQLQWDDRELAEARVLKAKGTISVEQLLPAARALF